jgi:hypothetical protein
VGLSQEGLGGLRRGVDAEGFWPTQTIPPPEEKTKARKRRNHKPEEEEGRGESKIKIKIKAGEAEREQAEGERLKGLRRREEILQRL